MKSQNYINGQWVGASDGKTFAQLNPADLEHVTGEWPQGTSADAEQAIEAAHAAFPAWADMGVYQRAEYLSRAVAVLKRRAEEIAAILTAEKWQDPRRSAHRNRIGSARDGVPDRPRDLHVRPDRALGASWGVCLQRAAAPRGRVDHQPLELSVQRAGAQVYARADQRQHHRLQAGEPDARSRAGFRRYFRRSRVTPGALNFVCGGGSTVGETMITHPLVQSISFTGSTQVGRGIQQRAAQGLIRTQLEMGGKNPAVILADADLDMAADAVVKAAYACAGQWCTSTSRAIAEREVAAAFTDKVLERVKQIRVGNGTEDGVDMGAGVRHGPARNHRGLHRDRQSRRSLHRARRRAPDRQRTRQRMFYCADGLYRCPAADAHRSGGDFRPGIVPNGSRGFLRGPRNRQWRGVWGWRRPFSRGTLGGLSSS